MMKKIVYIFMFFLFLITGIKAQNHSCTVNPYDYQFSMTITGVIKINNVESTDTADIVAAFSGTSCRGLAKSMFISSLNRYVVFFMLYSNAASGEYIKFKIFDAGSNNVMDVMDSVAFVPNNSLGLINDPYIWSVIGTGNQNS